jgi:4-hydroxy-4-methyl-2-oxoglutarate aldolase
MPMLNLRLIKNILNTAIISDVLDEFDINGMLSSQFIVNFESAKVCGFAKTVVVDKREVDAPINGIYNGLKIFDTVEPTDVIIIKNNLPHLAYWGDLNTTLALRAQASGTIVDGVTRDNARTKDLAYPVFSKGRYAKDIKNHGTINHLNCPVVVDQITIAPGDLIFGDIDGIAVIPKENINRVIERALQVASAEKEIIKDILLGRSAIELVEKHGFF